MKFSPGMGPSPGLGISPGHDTCWGDKMLDEMQSGSLTALCSICPGFIQAALNSASRDSSENREKSKLLPQALMLLTSWLCLPDRVWESLPLGLGLHCSLYFSQPYPSLKNKAWHDQSWSSLLACSDLCFPLTCVTIAASDY